MTDNTKQKKEETKEQRTEILQRLAQASVEGLVLEVAMNAVMPGSGIALNNLKQAKNMKKVAKVMGKSAAKEGVQMLDEEKEQEQSPTEDLTEDIALEFLSRSIGRG